MAKRTSNSFTEKAAEPKALERRQDNGIDPSQCKIELSGDLFPEAGQQLLVANPQTCSSGDCSFSINHGVTIGTSFTSSQGQPLRRAQAQAPLWQPVSILLLLSVLAILLNKVLPPLQRLPLVRKLPTAPPFRSRTMWASRLALPLLSPLRPRSFAG